MKAISTACVRVRVCSSALSHFKSFSDLISKLARERTRAAAIDSRASSLTLNCDHFFTSRSLSEQSCVGERVGARSSALI